MNETMHLQITLNATAGHSDELNELLETLRARLHDHISIMVAPPSFVSPLPFPLLTIEEDSKRNRLAGEDAIGMLRNLARQAA